MQRVLSTPYQVPRPDLAIRSPAPSLPPSLTHKHKQTFSLPRRFSIVLASLAARSTPSPGPRTSQQKLAGSSIEAKKPLNKVQTSPATRFRGKQHSTSHSRDPSTTLRSQVFLLLPARAGCFHRLHTFQQQIIKAPQILSLGHFSSRATTDQCFGSLFLKALHPDKWAERDRPSPTVFSSIASPTGTPSKTRSDFDTWCPFIILDFGDLITPSTQTVEDMAELPWLRSDFKSMSIDRTIRRANLLVRGNVKYI